MTTAKYWEDPHTFKPERFLGDWNRDAFLPFSGGKYLNIFSKQPEYSQTNVGYRACVGRKWALLILILVHFFLNVFRFSETEGAAVLTMLFSQYTVSIKDEPQFAGESFEQRKARVLDAKSILTLAYAQCLFPKDDMLMTA